MAPYIVRYPHKTEGTITEIWQGEKFNQHIPLDQLCPHYIDDFGTFFYVDEVARLSNGHFVIPKRWKMRDDGKLWADAFLLVKEPDGDAYAVQDTSMSLVLASSLSLNYLDLKNQGWLPQFHGM